MGGKDDAVGRIGVRKEKTELEFEVAAVAGGGGDGGTAGATGDEVFGLTAWASLMGVVSVLEFGEGTLMELCRSGVESEEGGGVTAAD